MAKRRNSNVDLVEESDNTESDSDSDDYEYLKVKRIKMMNPEVDANESDASLEEELHEIHTQNQMENDIGAQKKGKKRVRLAHDDVHLGPVSHGNFNVTRVSRPSGSAKRRKQSVRNANEIEILSDASIEEVSHESVTRNQKSKSTGVVNTKRKCVRNANVCTNQPSTSTAADTAVNIDDESNDSVSSNPSTSSLESNANEFESSEDITYTINSANGNVLRRYFSEFKKLPNKRCEALCKTCASNRRIRYTLGVNSNLVRHLRRVT